MIMICAAGARVGGVLGAAAATGGAAGEEFMLADGSSGFCVGAGAEMAMPDGTAGASVSVAAPVVAVGEAVIGAVSEVVTGKAGGVVTEVRSVVEKAYQRI